MIQTESLISLLKNSVRKDYKVIYTVVFAVKLLQFVNRKDKGVFYWPTASPKNHEHTK